jgi:TolB-like protein
VVSRATLNIRQTNMRMKNLYKKHSHFLKLFLLTVIFFLSACGTDNVVKERPMTLDGIKKILIMPFEDMSVVYGENKDVRCPVCGKVFTTGKASKGAADMLTERLFMLLDKRKDIQLIPSSYAQGVMSDLLAGSKKEFNEKDLAIETGRALHADAVLVGFIYRFQDRIGTEYSVDLPASVAFDIHLIRVKDGRVLWSGHFDETQRPLSDNLFRLGTFLQRKAKWITAKEMAFSGLENMLKSFPGPKNTIPEQ